MQTFSISAPTSRRRLTRAVSGVAAAAVIALAASVSAGAHHSFSIFDANKTRVFTGVVTRVNPDVNHLQIFFAVMNEQRTNVERDAQGKPVIWAIEMAGSAQAANEGISVNAFPPRTVISVGLHPLRSGEPAGDRGGSPLFKCPENTPPKPGKHCDSVDGHKRFGNGSLPTPTS
ncbi:MAG TPA: DUF6152 family protein [Vicinamibacterales bacterium]